uniref:Cytochrome P450, family 2, subfamily X, polypeptide 9 n=1 Tax=Gasterosteus aculeatus aculeatus TaxID=481459 RepID=A0AAQ4Q905_GASAC
MFASIILLLICVVFIVVQLKSRRPKNFPPGPPVWPILGNILDLSLENPLKDFERLKKTYGNVYSLFLGPKPVVVMNGMKTIKEALVTKGVDFAGRPQDLFVNDSTQRKGVILADYGSSWKEQRRFALMNLRNFGMGKDSMEERIHGEIQYTVDTLEKSIGKSFSPQNMFHNAASNIICQVLFGKRFEYQDETMKTLVQCFTENAKIANGPWAMLYDSFPLIRSLPLPFRQAFKNVEKIAKTLMNEHKQTRVPGEPRDFVDCYLDRMNSSPLSHSSEDRNNMPYVQAVIHEFQRVANTVPLSVFHCTTKDTELNGYSIPKGTLIIPNLTSVLNEEGQWKFPNEFNPENFLNDQGEFVKPEAFMPFSAGPRMCLGEGLARMELFLFTVTLLRKFKFIWPEDAGEPDFTPVYGVTLTPKPYRMKVQLRVSQKIPNL